MASASSSTAQLADRYAGALLALADEQQQVPQVEADMQGLRQLIAESEDFRNFVRSAIRTRDEFSRGIAAVAERAGFCTLTRNFLGVVAANRRLFAIDAMARRLLALLAERRGQVTAEVTLARPLSDEQHRALEGALRDTLGATVVVETRQDPAIIGGMIVKVGSRMVDSSVRTKLQRLQLAMKGVG